MKLDLDSDVVHRSNLVHVETSARWILTVLVIPVTDIGHIISLLMPPHVHCPTRQVRLMLFQLVSIVATSEWHLQQTLVNGILADTALGVLSFCSFFLKSGMTLSWYWASLSVHYWSSFLPSLVPCICHSHSLFSLNPTKCFPHAVGRHWKNTGSCRVPDRFGHSMLIHFAQLYGCVPGYR